MTGASALLGDAHEYEEDEPRSDLTFLAIIAHGIFLTMIWTAFFMLSSIVVVTMVAIAYRPYAPPHAFFIFETAMR